MPDVNADWWTIADVAAYAGLEVSTVRGYLARKAARIPQPDRRIGSTPVWRPKRIIEWQTARPGRGYWRKSA